MVHMTTILALTTLLGCSRSEPEEAPATPPEEGFRGVRHLTLEPGGTVLVAWDAMPEAEGFEVVAEVDGEQVRASASAEATTLRVDLSPWHEASGEALGTVAQFRVEALGGPSRDASDAGDGSLSLRLGLRRLELLSFEALPGIGDVWGQGDLIVVAGRDSGASFFVYDVADPTAPELLAEVTDAGFVRDVKLDLPYLYVTGECGCPGDPEARAAYDGIGVRVFDLTDPTEPQLLSTLGDADPYAEHRIIHNLSVEGDVLLLSDTPADAMPIIDVSDPTRPEEVARYVPPEGVVHDQVLLGDIAWVAWWRGFAAVDLAEPSEPVVLLEHQPSGVRAVHNVWPTADGSHLLVSSETGGGHLSVFDVQDPDAVEQVASVDPYPGAIIHNVVARDDGLAFVAWYRQGAVVVDLAQPSQPRVLDQFDTMAYGREVLGPLEGTDKAFAGAWGVWPFGDDELIVVSDMNAGLFLFRHHPIRVGRDDPAG